MSAAEVSQGCVLLGRVTNSVSEPLGALGIPSAQVSLSLRGGDG